MRVKAKTIGKHQDMFVNLYLHSDLQTDSKNPLLQNSSNTPDMRILLLDDDTESSSRVIELLEGNAAISKFETGMSEDLNDLLEHDTYDLLIITKAEYTNSLEELIQINRAATNIPAI